MKKSKSINAYEQPDNFNGDIKHLGGFRSLCAIRNSGELGCWDPNSLIFDEIIPK